MKDILILVLVLVAAGAVLLPTLDGGFLTDDYVITRLVTHGTLLPGRSAPPTWTSFFEAPETSGTFQLYRPVVALSWWFTVKLCGADQRSFRFVDLALHLLCGALLFALARHAHHRVTTMGAAVGVGIFLLSPIQMEVVDWSAARTETLSFAFGAAALAWKAARPRAVIGPALLAAAAAFAKESAIVFLPALLLADWASPQHDLDRDTKGIVPRGIFPLVLLAAWFGLRWWLFGSPLASSYGGREVGSVIGAGGGARIVTSLTTLARPVGVYADHAVDPTLLSWGFLATTVTAVLLGFLRWLDRYRGLLLAAFVFAVPFTMGTALNVIDERLVNTRAAYTPMGMLALIVAVGASGSRFRAAPAWALLVLCAVAARPTIDLHVAANHDVEAALNEMREASSEAAPTVRQVATLGWIDRDHLGGGFTLAGAQRCGMMRPFAPRDLESVVVRGGAADPTRTYFHAFPALFPHERRDLAFLGVREQDGAIEAELLWEGHRDTADGGTLTSTSPDAGARLTLSASDGAAITFSARTRALPLGTTLELEVFQPSGRVLPEPLLLEETTTSDGMVIDVTIPIPEPLWSDLEVARPFAWGVRARASDGKVVAVSGLRLLWVEVRP